ncbi:hypothetical protein ENUP19_0202G0022 [Entamoeba nuttalli]|uniref:Protein phosphatase domain containing protein n=2 Tax=Entamoeba nuttalli TaxID=412467 RepID=K2I0L6_ENTNP|nr:protein phosphatase domain containing protein [Entamoeba nuttalli P19]EKE42300.1 protein phosphatase domain containing protein [Entamoeba nuttalli P19]|eukprot:XP_008855368.1 protein phosphatase domain containing protein [Entamoeba nuttalli P19]
MTTKIGIYQSKINHLIIQNKENGSQFLKSIVNKAIISNEIQRLDINNIIIFCSTNGIITNYEVNVSLQQANNNLFIIFPKKYGFFIVPNPNYIIIDFIDISFILIKSITQTFNFCYSAFTQYFKTFPHVFDIVCPCFEYQNCQTTINVSVDGTFVVTRSIVYSPRQYELVDGYYNSLFIVSLKGKSILEDPLSIRILSNLNHRFCVYYDDGREVFVTHPKQEFKIGRTNSAMFRNVNRIQSERYFLNKEEPTIPIEKNTFHAGVIALFNEEKRKELAECLILIDVSNQDTIKDALFAIQQKLFHNKLTIVILSSDGDIVLNEINDEIRSTIFSKTLTHVKHQEALFYVNESFKSNKDIHVVLITEHQTINSDFTNILITGCQLTYIPTPELFTKIQHCLLNIFSLTRFNLITGLLSIELFLEALDSICYLPTVPSISHSSTFANFPQPIFYTFNRTIILYLCLSSETQSIKISTNDHLSTRSSIKLLEPVMYVLSQMIHWSITPIKLNPRTIIRENIMLNQPTKTSAKKIKKVTPGTKLRLSRSIGHSTEPLLSSHLNDKRNETLKKFSDIINITKADETGLNAIRVCDIKDRIISGYLQHYTDQIIPPSFHNDINQIYSMKNWILIPAKTTSTPHIPSHSHDKCIGIEEVDTVFSKFNFPLSKPLSPNDHCFSSHTETGPRKRNEDFSVYIDDLNSLLTCHHGRISVFGVFDGHMGTSASDYCSFKIFNYLVSNPHFPENIQIALKESFKQVNKGFLTIADVLHINAGTTAGVCVIDDKKITTANIGDTEIMFCKKNNKPLILSNKHSPNNETEKKRIELAGGKVFYFHGWRVEGLLGVSRSIGDIALKKFVIDEADTNQIERSPDDEFVLIGCDGLWNVISYDFCADIVREYLYTNNYNGVDENGIKKPINKKDIARYLVDLALFKQSLDNVTVSIYFFSK